MDAAQVSVSASWDRVRDRVGGRGEKAKGHHRVEGGMVTGDKVPTDAGGPRLSAQISRGRSRVRLVVNAAPTRGGATLLDAPRAELQETGGGREMKDDEGRRTGKRGGEKRR